MVKIKFSGSPLVKHVQNKWNWNLFSSFPCVIHFACGPSARIHMPGNWKWEFSLATFRVVLYFLPLSSMISTLTCLLQSGATIRLHNFLDICLHKLQWNSVSLSMSCYTHCLYVNVTYFVFEVKTLYSSCSCHHDAWWGSIWHLWEFL